MIIPFWFYLIWASSSATYGTVCAFILRREVFQKWPSLFIICADELASFAVLSSPIPYRLYFWFYWTNAAIIAALRIWLAYDVFRSLPGSRFIPQAIRLRILVVALLLGILCAAMTAPRSLPINAMLSVYLNRCVTLTWATVLVCCLGGLLGSGFGFSITGMRVAVGAVIRLISSMSLTMLYTSSMPHRYRIYVNTLDTIVAFAVAAYWCFAISDSARATAAFNADWEHHAMHAVQPQEKAGYQCTSN